MRPLLLQLRLGLRHGRRKNEKRLARKKRRASCFSFFNKLGYWAVVGQRCLAGPNFVGLSFPIFLCLSNTS